MVSRISFSSELLSQTMKSFVCRNQWIKLTWFGENAALSSSFGIGHHGHHIGNELIQKKGEYAKSWEVQLEDGERNKGFSDNKNTNALVPGVVSESVKVKV